MGKDIFILGAGFSKAVSANMPTLKELSDSVRDKLNNLFPDDEKPPEKILENIEMLLSYFSQDYPWLSESEKLRNKADFLDLSTFIAQEILNRHNKIFIKDFPQWFNDLVNTWHKNYLDIITFNYDILIENVAIKILAPITFDPQKNPSNLTIQDIYPVAFTPARMRQAAQISQGEHKTFQLYKMHGSVNWFYSGSQEFYGEPIYLAAPVENTQPYLTDKVPLIIPPTLDKTVYFKNETIRTLWRSAGRALKGATRVFCLGYSFPITDMMVRFFVLTNSSKDKVQFYWINLSPHKDGLKSLLPNNFEINENYVGGDNPIQRFAEDYINNRI